MPTAPCVLAVVRESAEFEALSAGLAGIEVCHASDVLDATLQHLYFPAAVIICDADYVDWRTALALFNRWRDKPEVIFLSRCADESLWMDMLRAGARDLLAKTCRPEELRRGVCSALTRRRD